jgi:hypothetical protein
LVVDRATLLKRLRTAERHAQLGSQHMARQRQIVSALARGGHDTTLAETVLAAFETAQDGHINDRDRFAAQLAAVPA